MNKQFYFLLLFILGCFPAVWGQSDLFLDWANVINNTQGQGGYCSGIDIKVDAQGNTYVTGTFTGIVDFDPSEGVLNLTSTGRKDIFLAKYNVSGNYVYAKAIGGESDDSASSLVLDSNDNIYITGSFQGVADFDPSTSIANLNATGGNDIFVAKYDASGNYLYAKSMGGTNNDLSKSITVDGSGNVYITGQFSGIADFDPSTVVVNLTSAGNSDIFLAKYDATGNYLYAISLGGTSDESGNSVSVDGAGNAYITGQFKGIVDFDQSEEHSDFGSAGNSDIFLAKYDVLGNYVYAIPIRGTGEDVGNSLIVDSVGNVYLTGFFNNRVDFDPSMNVANLGSSSGGQSVFLAKYDASLNFVYAKGIEGTYGIGNDIALDGNGNAYITGAFRGTLDFDPSAGVVNLTNPLDYEDVFFAKYDALGNYVYAKKIGGSRIDKAYSMAVDGSGNAHVIGDFSNTADFDPAAEEANIAGTANAVNCFVGKYDSFGNYVWAKGLISNFTAVLGVSAMEMGHDTLGNIYVCGTFTGTVDFDPSAGVANLANNDSQDDIFLAKYDASGNYIYAKRIGGTGLLTTLDMAVDGSGNAYLTGGFLGTMDFDPSAVEANLVCSDQNSDIFLAKYDASGNYVYAKSMGGLNDDTSHSVAVDSNGSVYLTGVFADTADFDPSANTANLISIEESADVFLAKYDASGNYVYAKSIGGLYNETAFSIAVDGNGNSYLTGLFSGTVDFDPSAGVANLISANPSNDIFLAKYDVSGNYIYAKAIKGNAAAAGKNLVVDGSGNSYIMGSFEGTVDFDPSAAVANIASNGSSDVFFAKYDTSGNYIYAKSIGGSSYDDGRAMAVDSNGNIYVSGWYQGTVDFNPAAEVANYASIGATDVFLAKYDASGNYIYNKSIGGTNEDGSSALTIDGNGNVYVIGDLYSTVDFDPSEGTYYLTPANQHAAFVARYTEFSLTTGNIDTTISSNATVVVPYTATGMFNTATGRTSAGNVFTAQLSDAVGSFANPVAIGSVNSTTSGNIVTVIPTVPASNGYRIRVVSSSPALIGNSNGNNISINATPAPIASAQTFCNSVSVANLVASGTGIQWYAGSTTMSPLLQSDALTTGTYYVTQTISQYESPRLPVAVTVNVVGAPTGQAMQTVSVAVPTEATIEDLTVSGSNIIWYPTATDSAAGTNAIAAGTQLTNGVYYATQTIDGCSSTASLAVTVTVTTLGVDQFDVDGLRYYPNPVKEELNISYSHEISYVEMYNLLGQQVMSVHPNELDTKIDLGKLPTGTYLMKVSSEGKSVMIKVVKN